ncbi:MAG: hypothetical protein RLZZ417_2390 [Bacteroidota bacterium]|jgi:ribosomal protein S18 acetylase RimI-like enzyme
MKISKALLSDIPDICKIVNHAYRGEEAKKGWTYESDLIEGDKRTSEMDLFSLISKEGATILVAKNEFETIVGTVFLEVKESNLYMGMLSVEPVLQGKGMGKMLVLNAIEIGKLKGLKNIQIQVVNLRYELIAWYEKLGFILSGKKFPFQVPVEFGKPKVPIHFIEMYYPLIVG